MIALQNRPGVARKALGALALGAAMVVAAPAPAQFGLAGGIGDAFRPAYTTRDVQLAVDMLRLDDAQKFIVETLYEDYDSEFRLGVDNFRNNVAGLRDKIDPGNPDPAQIMRIVFGTINEWQVDSKQLADQFKDDLRALLNEEQQALWPAFERKLYRLKYIRNGQLPAESLDLTNEILDLDLPKPVLDRIKPLIEEYEIALDTALRAREEYMAKSQTELISAVQDANYSIGLDVAQRQVELRKAVRDVNEQYTLAFAAALPEEQGTALTTSIRQQTYPRIYRDTPAQRALEAAVLIEDLDQDTRAAIEELTSQYMYDLGVFNENLMQMTRDFKPREIQHKVEQAAARLSGDAPAALEDPLRDEFVKRRELGDRYIEQLKALLTPEQFAGLPGARRWLQEDAALAGMTESEALRLKRERYMKRAPGVVDGDTTPGVAVPGTTGAKKGNTQSEKKTED